jgi:hypothetical protein
MANIITAGNSTNGGTSVTTDTSGTLNIVTGSGSGANAITIDASQNVVMAANQTVAGNVTVTGTLNAGALTNTTGSFSGNLSFNSGYGSAAVAYGCRAWVNFNGTGTIAIRSSGNVSSITDRGIGEYTVNFTTAMPDVNYAVTSLTDSASSGTALSMFTRSDVAYSTSAVAVTTRAFNTASGVDSSIVNVSIFR